MKQWAEIRIIMKQSLTLDSIEYNRHMKHKDLFMHIYKGFGNLSHSYILAVDNMHMKTP